MKSAATNIPLLTEQECLAKIRSLGQELLWISSSLEDKKHLQQEITLLDAALIRRMQAVSETISSHHLEAFVAYASCGNHAHQALGKQFVQDGKAAVIILAGGQGSRLRYEGPKGCYPITLVKKKSLFQYCAEKVKAASVQAGRDLDLAIMTSPLNRAETEAFFTAHDFFGLKPSQISFFEQAMWPLLDLSGKLFLDGPGQIAKGPNGNGSVYHSLVASGIWNRWNQKGIVSVNVVPVDNPLADPFDFELLGAHIAGQCEVTAKTTFRRDAEENVGVLALINGKPGVVEYSEMSAEEKNATDPQGNLKFGIANLSLLCFSMSFIKKVGEQELPLHRAKKAVKIEDRQGHILFPEQPNAWKFETFIFDSLPLAQRVQALVYPRAICFAPLKNLKGADSIDSVQAALLAFDQKVYTEVTGVQPPEGVRFELAPQFYYPTEDWLKKWKGIPFPKDAYIEGHS